MTRIVSHVSIDAPREQVWEVLADLGGIYKWNPGVSQSHATSEQGRGEGATRHCDLQNPTGYLEERAFDWREGESYKIDVYDGSLPIHKNTVEFAVSPNGAGTRVTAIVDYQLKYGPLGVLMDVLFARRQAQKGFDDLLAGLKYHVETGELVNDQVPVAAGVTV